MSKEQLETNLAALELLQNETNDKLTDYKAQIAQVKKDIEDINKPELTPIQLDAIYEAGERAMGEFDFNDLDNFAIDYGVDYDGKVYCESHDFQNSGDLVESICDKVARLFKEVEEKPTTESDNS